MKLSLTTVATDTFTVTNGGKTIGETINDMIRSNMDEGLTVTNISVEVTQEDTVALRLMQSPATTARQTYTDLTSKKSLKPYADRAV